MSKELEALKSVALTLGRFAYTLDQEQIIDEVHTIRNALEEKEKLETAIKDLFASHIEFVAEKDKCYFKIKNSKGKEKSFTSKTFEDFWKEVLR